MIDFDFDNAAFFDADVFGETIEYIPAGGVARQIVAIVDRQRVEPAPGETRRTYLRIEITAANNATTGIFAPDVNLKSDKVRVARRPGGPLEEMRFAGDTGIGYQDAGAVKWTVD